MRLWALLFMVVLSACVANLPAPCPDGPRDSGIGGTGQCDPVEVEQ